MAFVTQLDQYALTTLVRGLYYLGLTTDGGTVDNYIERLINRASDMIEEALNRKLKLRLHIKERHSGNGKETLYFKQYPVLAINLDELVWTADKKVTRSDGGSFITDGWNVGDPVLVQNSNSNSGALTIASGGLAALVLTFDQAIVADSQDDNVILSHFRELWINDNKIDEDDYEVNENHIYCRSGFTEGHENIRMSYHAGYYNDYRRLPDDIEGKCLELIKMAYEKNRDVKSEKLGPYSITFFDNKAKIIESIRDDLSSHINVVIG